MKTSTLLLVLLLNCFIGLSQEKDHFFNLYQNEIQFQNSNCLNQYSNFIGFDIILIDDAPESYNETKLLLYINDNSSMSFA